MSDHAQPHTTSTSTPTSTPTRTFTPTETKSFPLHTISSTSSNQFSMTVDNKERIICPGGKRLRRRQRLSLRQCLASVLILPTAASFLCEELPEDTWEALVQTIDNSYGFPICPFKIKGKKSCKGSSGGYDVLSPDLYVMCDTISSNNGIGECIIDCPGRHFTVHEGAKLTLHGVTLRGATEASVVVSDNAKFFAFDSSFERNSNEYGNGGAIHGTSESEITAVDTGFYFNKALNGGAIYNSGKLNVGGSDFYFNDAMSGSGGAIFSGTTSSTMINENVIRKNSASFYGPAVFDGSIVDAVGTTSPTASAGNVGCENENSFNINCDGIFSFTESSCATFENFCNARSTYPPKVQEMLDEDPFVFPTQSPSDSSSKPSSAPSQESSYFPSSMPSVEPSLNPSAAPSRVPSSIPTCHPSTMPSSGPTLSPSSPPSQAPSTNPSGIPSTSPSMLPTTQSPSAQPTTSPTYSAAPSSSPTSSPTYSSWPSSSPTSSPTYSAAPSSPPTSSPTNSVGPSSSPTLSPTSTPSSMPSRRRSMQPSAFPSMRPTTHSPSASPVSSPTPSQAPSSSPSGTPSASPSENRTTMNPSAAPSTSPIASPSFTPSSAPTAHPSKQPKEEAIISFGLNVP